MSVDGRHGKRACEDPAVTESTLRLARLGDDDAFRTLTATNRCLNALRDRGRRPREAPGLPFEVPEPTRRGEPLWLEPYPDALLEGIAETAPGPEARYETKEAVTL